MINDQQNRRKFLSKMLGICVSGSAFLKGFTQEKTNAKIFYPIRKRLLNPYLENGKPVVIIVKGTDFPKMLAKGMELLNGFSRFGNNKSVIIKPNFVFDKKSQYPTTTDEGSVLTTIQYLQNDGFKNICVADRRGKKKKGRAGGKFEWSGLNDKAAAGGFSTDSLMDNEIAEAVQVKDERWTEMPSIGVIKKIYKADFIINMPTLKKHTMTNFTCSLKNMMGVLDVPTTEKMHLWGKSNKITRDSMSDDMIIHRLCLTIAEAALAVNPDLTIIDARKVLCKDHLSVRTGEPREAYRIIISGDSLAADIWAAKILKEVYNPFELGFTKDTFEYAAKLGLGVADPNGIVLKQVEV